MSWFISRENNYLTEALESYEKTITFNPQHINSFNNMASIYARKRQTDKALKIYEMIKDQDFIMVI